MSFRLFQYALCRHHHAQVDHLEIIARKYNPDNVFADIVYIAFYRGHDNLSGILTAGRILVFELFRLDKWEQISHCLFHHSGRFYHLRKKHFPGAKQIAHHVHPVH